MNTTHTTNRTPTTPTPSPERPMNNHTNPWADEQLIEHAENINEHAQAMTRDTVIEPVFVASTLYTVLGDLHTAGFAQLLRQLGQGLTASARCYTLTEDNPERDPETSIALAVEQLRHAAHAAEELTRHLVAAQNAIAGQGHQGYHKCNQPNQPNQPQPANQGDPWAKDEEGRA